MSTLPEWAEAARRNSRPYTSPRQPMRPATLILIGALMAMTAGATAAGIVYALSALAGSDSHQAADVAQQQVPQKRTKLYYDRILPDASKTTIISKERRMK